jgi:hypothetical protein
MGLAMVVGGPGGVQPNCCLGQGRRNLEGGGEKEADGVEKGLDPLVA